MSGSTGHNLGQVPEHCGVVAPPDVAGVPPIQASAEHRGLAGLSRAATGVVGHAAWPRRWFRIGGGGVGISRCRSASACFSRYRWRSVRNSPHRHRRVLLLVGGVRPGGASVGEATPLSASASAQFPAGPVLVVVEVPLGEVLAISRLSSSRPLPFSFSRPRPTAFMIAPGARPVV